MGGGGLASEARRSVLLNILVVMLIVSETPGQMTAKVEPNEDCDLRGFHHWARQQHLSKSATLH